jgi:hypothetical protein
VNRADARRWRAARSLADLGELVTAWLRGDITETPAHAGGPDSETLPLAAVLAAVNRAGFVTDNSQLAEAGGGQAWNTWVRGFATDVMLARIRAAAAGTALTVTACRGRTHGERHGWRDGWRCPARETLSFWASACPGAAAELRRCWYTEVADPEPGRNDLLWSTLAGAVGAELPPPGPAASGRARAASPGGNPHGADCGHWPRSGPEPPDTAITPADGTETPLPERRTTMTDRVYLYHVSPARNRESIRATGLDKTRCSRGPRVYLSDEAGARFRAGGGSGINGEGRDIWKVDVTGIPLREDKTDGSGSWYAQRSIPPERVALYLAGAQSPALPVPASRAGGPATAPGPGAAWKALITATGEFDPEDDSRLLAWMSGEAAGMAGYAEAVDAVRETAATAIGLDPAALQALDDCGSAAAAAAEQMATARQRFTSHYAEVRQFAAAGGVLPYNGRWMTSEENHEPEAGTLTAETFGCPPGVQFFHGTHRVFEPGALIQPASRAGVPVSHAGASDPDYAHATSSLLDAAEYAGAAHAYAKDRGEASPGMFVYKVEPTGDTERDPALGAGTGARRSTSPWRVTGRVPDKDIEDMYDAYFASQGKR